MFTSDFINTFQTVTTKLVDEAEAKRAAATTKEEKKAATITKPDVVRAVAAELGDETMAEMSNVLLSHLFSLMQETGNLPGLVCIQGPYGGVQRPKAKVAKAKPKVEETQSEPAPEAAEEVKPGFENRVRKPKPASEES